MTSTCATRSSFPAFLAAATPVAAGHREVHRSAGALVLTGNFPASTRGRCATRSPSRRRSCARCGRFRRQSDARLRAQPPTPTEWHARGPVRRGRAAGRRGRRDRLAQWHGGLNLASLADSSGVRAADRLCASSTASGVWRCTGSARTSMFTVSALGIPVASAPQPSTPWQSGRRQMPTSGASCRRQPGHAAGHARRATSSTCQAGADAAAVRSSREPLLRLDRARLCGAGLEPGDAVPRSTLPGCTACCLKPCVALISGCPARSARPNPPRDGRHCAPSC